MNLLLVFLGGQVSLWNRFYFFRSVTLYVDDGSLTVREPSAVSNLNLIDATIDVRAIIDGSGTLTECNVGDSENVVSGDLSCEP